MNHPVHPSPGPAAAAATKTIAPALLAGNRGNDPELAADHARILAAADALLQQGEDLVGALESDTFARRVPVVFNASIGGHYRHCLDHFSRLVAATENASLNYDHRERDPRLESDPALAARVTGELREALRRLPLASLATPLTVRCEVSYTRGDSPRTRSTLARELTYCVAHAIHHFALISVIARLLGLQLPEHFGVAPSTVAHLASLDAAA